MPHTHTLEFDSAHFLQSLFAHDESLLKLVEDRLGVRVTTRDGWLRFDGDPDKVDEACRVFQTLEEARRSGAEITPHAFRSMFDRDAGENGDGDGPRTEAAGRRLSELLGKRLLGSANKPAVVPKTWNQLHYLKTIESNPVVFGLGPAGTGKTYLAMAMALSALKNREVNRVILSRPAVEAGEALGFLPGDLEEKISPYLRPLYDAIYDMLEPGEVEKFIERNMIEIAPLAYMRGRTLNRAFVILDEAQNTTEEQMFMFLTRLGEQSRCVVTGDPSQVDLRPSVPSGLREAESVLGGVDGVAFVRFSNRDVIRHPVVQAIIDAYDQARKERPSRKGSQWPKGGRHGNS